MFLLEKSCLDLESIRLTVWELNRKKSENELIETIGSTIRNRKANAFRRSLFFHFRYPVRHRLGAGGRKRLRAWVRSPRSRRGRGFPSPLPSRRLTDPRKSIIIILKISMPRRRNVLWKWNFTVARTAGRSSPS